MGKMARDKGSTFERDIANDLTAHWGVKIKRNIGQARDGGDDITVPPFRIECKRYAKIAVYKWLHQCMAACKPGDLPVVIARADNEEAIVIMRYSLFKTLARDELTSKHTLGESDA